MNAAGLAVNNPDGGLGLDLAPTRRSLLERLRNVEDHASWQEFFDLYWKAIYSAAVRSGLSEQDAEEVVQDTILGVSRGLESFRYDPAVCPFRGWLMHITRRRIVDVQRKRRTPGGANVSLVTDQAGHAAELEFADPNAEAAFEVIWNEGWQESLLEAALAKVRARVEPEQYQVFYLSVMKNLPVRDVRKLLGVSAAKVYLVRHRLARMVRDEIANLAKGERIPGVSP